MLDFARPGVSTDAFLLKSVHFEEDLRDFGRGGGFFNDPASVRSALKDVGAAYHNWLFATCYFCERWLRVMAGCKYWKGSFSPAPVGV